MPEQATQAQTYATVAKTIVDDVLNGFNGTILAYGQTGTGKTHTIYGPLAAWSSLRASPDDVQVPVELSGIVARASLHIFDHIEKCRAESEGRETWTVRVSSLQIYQEAITDMLAPPPPPGGRVPLLNIREDPVLGVHADGLSTHEASSVDELLALIADTATQRATGSTTMNRDSSRSHAMLLLRVEQAIKPDEPQAEVAVRRSLLIIATTFSPLLKILPPFAAV